MTKMVPSEQAPPTLICSYPHNHDYEDGAIWVGPIHLNIAHPHNHDDEDGAIWAGPIHLYMFYPHNHDDEDGAIWAGPIHLYMFYPPPHDEDGAVWAGPIHLYMCSHPQSWSSRWNWCSLSRSIYIIGHHTMGSSKNVNVFTTFQSMYFQEWVGVVWQNTVDSDTHIQYFNLFFIFQM